MSLVRVIGGDLPHGQTKINKHRFVMVNGKLSRLIPRDTKYYPEDSVYQLRKVMVRVLTTCCGSVFEGTSRMKHSLGPFKGDSSHKEKCRNIELYNNEVQVLGGELLHSEGSSGCYEL